MGDSRYYTFDQFIVVVFLTIFLLCLTISTITPIYHGLREYKKTILFSHILLGCASILQIVSAVVPCPSSIELSQQGTFFCLSCSFITISLLLFATKERSKSYFDSWLIFDHYKHPPYSLLFFILPSLLVAADFFIADPFGNPTVLLIYPCWLVTLHIFTANFKVYRIGRHVYSAINDQLQDAVLVCDVEHNVIYRNSHADKTTFLQKGITTLPAGDPATAFTDEFEQTKEYSLKTFVSKNRKQWLQYKAKEIHLNKQKVGQVVIFSDITHLIEILKTQDDSQKRLEELNRKLHHYSSIVFDLEKEKETTLLLENITYEQVMAMQDIGRRTEKLLATSNSNIADSQTTLDRLIEDAKSNMDRIRNIIMRYRRFYSDGDQGCNS